MTHMTPFPSALDGGSVDRLAEHLSDGVVLNSPLLPDPFTGKEKVLRSAIDTFETTAIIAEERRAAVIIRIRAGEAEVTGVDLMTADARGLIDGMAIQWRPLGASVAIQQKLAPLIDIPALELVARAA